MFYLCSFVHSCDLVWRLIEWSNLSNRKLCGVSFYTWQTINFLCLTCFLVDDGSSSCCCWADAERAATLLRLQERLPKRAFKSSDWSFRCVGVNDKASCTATYHLWRMLKTYKRITVKNYGSCFDLPYQNHVSVTPGNALCTSDANLLNLIIFISCFGGLWVSLFMCFLNSFACYLFFLSSRSLFVERADV